MVVTVRWSDVKQYVLAQDAKPTATASWATSDDDDDEDERRASVVRNCVCAMLCVVAGVAVLALLGSALLGASASSSYMERVLHHVKQASVVEFAVVFKPEKSEEATVNRRRYRLRTSKKRHLETAAQARRLAAEGRLQFYDPSVVKVSGSLMPRISEDSGQLRFDGWIQVETNASEVHELVLANHRGYRTTRALPSMKVVSEGCLSTRDLPPLHTLEAIPGSAFRADEFSAFDVNCTVGEPIEMLFMDVPFVFCADEGVVGESLVPSKSKAPLLAVEEAGGTIPKTLAFHSKRATIQANLVSKKTENKKLAALEGASESGSGSGAGEAELEATATLWRSKAKSVSASCEYLEAPMTSGRGKKSFLYHLLPSR